jgi:hypothetical protein
MPPRKKTLQLVPFQVIQLKASGRFLGVVHAIDEDDARATAIVRFDIREPDKVHLLARPV